MSACNCAALRDMAPGAVVESRYPCPVHGEPRMPDGYTLLDASKRAPRTSAGGSPPSSAVTFAGEDGERDA